MSSDPAVYQPDKVAAVWDKVSLKYNYDAYVRGPENQANLLALLDHIGDPAGKRIIEVGCGSGFTSLALAQGGAQCALLDLSPEALAGAKAGFARHGLPEPECYLNDALHSTVPSDRFDLVWNGGVIEHFYDAGKALLIQEMLRMAKPGGRVVILVPNRWCWQFQIVQAWQKLRGTWKYGFEDDMSPRRLRRMAESLGIRQLWTYAFNPVVGWRWVPKLRRLLNWLDLETVEQHCRRTPTGFVSVLVIHKSVPGDPPSATSTRV
jgi:SAM-dependent methyltransferase